jgi:hypothetical protein
MIEEHEHHPEYAYHWDEPEERTHRRVSLHLDGIDADGLALILWEALAILHGPNDGIDHDTHDQALATLAEIGSRTMGRDRRVYLECVQAARKDAGMEPW